MHAQALALSVPSPACLPIPAYKSQKTYPYLDLQTHTIQLHHSYISLALDAKSPQPPFKMSSSKANLFRDICNQVRDIVDLYIGENSSENAAEFAGMIQLAKANFAASISTLPEQLRANFFNEAVARVVLEKVADVTKNGSNGALLNLTLTMLYGPEMQEPTDWINLGVFLDEATARLTVVRTRIMDWLVEGGGGFVRQDLRIYEHLGCFMAGLFTELQESGASQLAEDLRAAGGLGMRIIADTVRVHKANIIPPALRETPFLVAFAWLADSDGYFVKELVRADDMQEIRFWHEQFLDFLRRWEWTDADFAVKVSREVGRFSEALFT